MRIRGPKEERKCSSCNRCEMKRPKLCGERGFIAILKLYMKFGVGNLINHHIQPDTLR